MDAFVVRRPRRTAAIAASSPAASSPSPPRASWLPLPPPRRQLAASDCALLLALAPDEAAPVERALAAAGAATGSATGSASVSVPSVDGRDVTLLVVGASATQAAVDAAVRSHPRAAVVPVAWITGVAETTKEEDSGDDGQPVRKKPRRDADVEAGPPADDASTADVRAPTLTRAWEEIDNGALYFLDTRQDQASASGRPLKLAAFDLDGTLIVTKSGKRFAQHAHDWKLLDASRVAATLRRLAREGFTLAILSNQNGVTKGKTSAREVQTKLCAVVEKLQVPMLVLFATRDDEMRKPRTGAWRWLLARLGVSETHPLDASASLYCGDAAGRPKIAGRNKDFAATDYLFALNAGVQFFTPEALFLESTQRIHTRPEMWEIDFDPRTLPVGGAGRLDPPDTELARAATREIVVLVGPPASGKSHFAAKFTGYTVVCQDDLKTVAKCVVACSQALQAGNSVVVDCTNRDPRGRKDWIELAKKHGAAVRCFYMDVAKPLSMHLNTFRKLTTSKDIPDIAIHTFYKNYVVPQKEEGFDAVVKVRFRVDTDSLSPADRQLISSFL